MALVAVVVVGIVAGAVWFKRNQSDEIPAADEAAMTTESAPAVASGGHRYAKFIELSGFRVTEDSRRRASMKMAVTNHSTADLGGLTLVVTLKTSQGKDVGTSNVTVASLGPLETVDVNAPLKTSLRAYELPDWQFIRAEFQITSK